MPRLRFPNPAAPLRSRRSLPAPRAPRCISFRARRRQTGRPVRSRRMWARSTWLVFPSARIIPGKATSRTMQWSPLAVPPCRVLPRANRASWSPRRVRCCAASRPSRAVIGNRPSFRWGRRFRSGGCLHAWSAWGTRAPTQPMLPVSSACRAIPSKSGPPNPRPRCVSSSLAMRSTASASWWRRPARRSAMRSRSR